MRSPFQRASVQDRMKTTWTSTGSTAAAPAWASWSPAPAAPATSSVMRRSRRRCVNSGSLCSCCGKAVNCAALGMQTNVMNVVHAMAGAKETMSALAACLGPMGNPRVLAKEPKALLAKLAQQAVYAMVQAPLLSQFADPAD